MAWHDVHIGFDHDDFELDGLKVWEHEWRAVDCAPLQLPHPQYRHQIHRFRVYDIGDRAKPVRFAAGELSNSVWGFYVPDWPKPD